MYLRTNLNSIFEDLIIFRELNVIKKDFPKFEKLKEILYLEKLPRKKDKDYALFLSYIIDYVGDFNKVIYIGDTFLNDKSVIENLSKLNKYEVYGIITEGKGKLKKEDNIVINNYWENLKYIFNELNINFDKKTFIIADIDKTLIGARGRNDLSIDKARFDAIREVSKKYIKDFNEELFFSIYKFLNRKEFHIFTEDNQDIVTLLAIAFNLNLYSFKKFIYEFENGIWKDKISFFERVLYLNRDRNEFIEIIKECLYKMKNDDPTPFLEFRYKEFEATIKRIDFLSDETETEKLLSEEILITKEVYQILIEGKENGSTIFGLSDKPEASTMPKENSKLPPIYKKKFKIFPK
jgi:hypothetical protein